MSDYLSIDEYLRRPYSRVLIPDADTGTYTAEIAEFPGCVAQEDSPGKAYDALEEVAREWLAAMMDAGKAIPEPLAENEYSGRIALRLPRSLHKQAAECAQFEETSLNQFLVAATAEKVGASKMYAEYACRFHAQWVPTVTVSAVFVAHPTAITSLDARPTLASTPADSRGLIVMQPVGKVPVEERS